MTSSRPLGKHAAQSTLLNLALFYIPIIFFGLTGLIRIYADSGLYFALATWASAATGLMFLRVVSNYERRLGISKDFLLIILLLAFAFAITSLFYPELAFLGLKSLGQPLIFGLSCYIIYSRTRTFERGLLLIKVLLLLNVSNGLRQAIFGLTNVETLLLTNSGSSFLVGDQSRVLGFQNSGQDFAFLAGITFVYGAVGWLRDQNAGTRYKFEQMLNVALISVGAVASIASLQRSIMIGIVIALAALSVNSVRTKSGRKFVAYAVMVSTLVLAAGSLLLSDRFSLALDRLANSQSLTDGSFQTRSLVTVPLSLGLISESPWFGYGLGSSGPAAAQAPNGPLFAFPLGGTIADNGYFYLTLQLGIPAALVFLFVLFKWAFTNKILNSSYEFEEAKTLNPLIFYLLGCMLGGSFLPLSAPMTILIIVSVGWQSKPLKLI
jgi:O-antigen ligase